MLSRNKLLFLIATIQVLFFSGWYYLESKKLNEPTSKTILVKTVPVDPRDFLSGNYLILRYEFSNLLIQKNIRSERSRKAEEKIYYPIQENEKTEGNGAESKKTETEIYAVLKKDNIWYVPDYFSYKKPSLSNDQVAIKGKYNKYSREIEYGIEKYFINEDNKEPKMEDKVEVSLIVGDDSIARIKNVMVNDIPFK